MDRGAWQAADRRESGPSMHTCINLEPRSHLLAVTQSKLASLCTLVFSGKVETEFFAPLQLCQG